MTGGDELGETRHRLRHGVGAGDADDVEVLGARVGDEQRLLVSRRAFRQKSRSA